MGVTQWWRRITGRGGTKDQGRGAATAARPRGAAAPRPRPAGTPQPKGSPGRRPAPDASLPVLGVDVCRAGWVGAVLDATGHGTPALIVRPTLAELVAEAGPLAVVGIHVPMGLPDGTRREADVQTRRLLGAAASSVFTTPVRDALYAATFGEANQLNRERLGSGISQQAYGLRPRIMEVDTWLRQDLAFAVVEVHPEASFTEMTGAPLGSRKRSAQGAEERRRALAATGVAVPGSLPVGVGADDVIDACAAAWSAHRVKLGQARTIPDPPETFSDGIPAAVHV
jgi:predicted RNase H-like nuclease